ncbi:hypothetical protein BH11MYX1_BH11MYX1_39520 [soil metagenome]
MSTYSSSPRQLNEVFVPTIAPGRLPPWTKQPDMY